jgi:hypothetical protein
MMQVIRALWKTSLDFSSDRPQYLSATSGRHACHQAHASTISIGHLQAAFVQLVNAIERRHDPSVKAFYWIDILNCAQCRHTDWAKQMCKDDGGKFAETIAISEARVWMHCEPWHNPRTFGRVWYAISPFSSTVIFDPKSNSEPCRKIVPWC